MLKMLVSKIKRLINPTKYWMKQGVTMGGGCEIYPSAEFGSEPYLITLGNHVRINSGVKFITHDGGVWILRYLYEKYKDIDLFGAITVGNNVHIGTNAIIMPGVTIGNNCIIGCNAVVTHNVPDGYIVAGMPARVIESIEEYVQKNDKSFLHTKNFSRQQKMNFLLQNKEKLMKKKDNSTSI